jgi:hypothetical protein
VKIVKQTNCTKCNKNFFSRRFANHFKICGVEKEYKPRIYKKRPQIDPNRMNCIFCENVCKNYNSRINHERLCKKNPNRDTSFFIEHQDKLKEIKNSPEFQYHNHYTKAKALGLPKIVTEEVKNHLKHFRENRTPDDLKKMGESVSRTINKKVKEGTWHTSLAKKMHYNYNGVSLHGTWELNYAKWLDKNNIKWERCKKSFSYFFENKKRRYTPDFFLQETNEYIEIKGYKTIKDEYKWNQFPSNFKLTILFKKDLKQIGIL